MAGRIGSGQDSHLFKHFAQIHVVEMQIARPREVDEDLHDAVEPANFVADDVDVAARLGIVLLHFVLQQLQVQHDGVDRILNFVSDAARESAAGGKAARDFNLIFNPANRFGIAHGEQARRWEFPSPE